MGSESALSQQRSYSMSSHPFFEAQSINFDPRPLDGIKITPQCLRAKGYKLFLMDSGHDESPLSMRSEARRSEQSREKEFLRPRIHEGKLNQLVSWLVYDLILKGSHLNALERRELSTMIRFTRHPGERVFGDYEQRAGYSNSNQGEMDSSVLNRVDRVNFAMNKHRLFDPSRADGWSQQTTSVPDETLFVSIHSNNSGGVYDDADYSWIILDPEAHLGSMDYVAARKMAESFDEILPDYLEESSNDSAVDKRLKFESRDAFALSRTKIMPLTRPLKMMSRMVGSDNTTKFLTESFFMTGKVGHLLHRELEDSSRYKAVQFFRGSQKVADYQVSRLYMMYAQSVVLGINRYLGCD